MKYCSRQISRRVLLEVFVGHLEKLLQAEVLGVYGVEAAHALEREHTRQRREDLYLAEVDVVKPGEHPAMPHVYWPGPGVSFGRFVTVVYGVAHAVTDFSQAMTHVVWSPKNICWFPPCLMGLASPNSIAQLMRRQNEKAAPWALQPPAEWGNHPGLQEHRTVNQLVDTPGATRGRRELKLPLGKFPQRKARRRSASCAS